MQDFHDIFTSFKSDFPEIYAHYETLGRDIHERSGPLDDSTRWLLKIVISGASRHATSLETHIRKGKEAGLTDAQIRHALLLLIQTTGFPTFMEAYKIYKNLE